METIIGKKTVEEYKKLPEGAPYELIEGMLVKEPAPEYNHQRTIVSLVTDLHQFVKNQALGEVLVAPIDVYLDEENVFQPDILFVSRDNLSKVERDGIHGAPDLVIEILSPSNAFQDFTTKFHIYERHSVKEYFIVDPDSKEVIAYSMVAGKFRESYRETGIIDSRLLNQQFHF